jgi:hypothetical protein
MLLYGNIIETCSVGYEMTLFQLQHRMKWKGGYEYEIISKKSAVAYLKIGLQQCDCKYTMSRDVPVSLHAVSLCGAAPSGKPNDQNHKELMKLKDKSEILRRCSF